MKSILVAAGFSSDTNAGSEPGPGAHVTSRESAVAKQAAAIWATDEMSGGFEATAAGQHFGRGGGKTVVRANTTRAVEGLTKLSIDPGNVEIFQGREGVCVSGREL